MWPRFQIRLKFLHADYMLNFATTNVWLGHICMFSWNVRINLQVWNDRFYWIILSALDFQLSEKIAPHSTCDSKHLSWCGFIKCLTAKNKDLCFTEKSTFLFFLLSSSNSSFGPAWTSNLYCPMTESAKNCVYILGINIKVRLEEKIR